MLLGQREHPRPWIDKLHRQGERVNEVDPGLCIRTIHGGRNCPNILSGEANGWIGNIICGSVNTYTALVPALLPSLRVIELLQRLPVGDYVPRMSHHILVASQEPHDRSHILSTSLQRYEKTLVITTTPRNEVECLVQLLVVPAANTIHCE